MNKDLQILVTEKIAISEGNSSPKIPFKIEYNFPVIFWDGRPSIEKRSNISGMISTIHFHSSMV